MSTSSTPPYSGALQEFAKALNKVCSIVPVHLVIDEVRIGLTKPLANVPNNEAENTQESIENVLTVFLTNQTALERQRSQQNKNPEEAPEETLDGDDGVELEADFNFKKKGYREARAYFLLKMVEVFSNDPLSDILMDEKFRKFFRRPDDTKAQRSNRNKFKEFERDGCIELKEGTKFQFVITSTGRNILEGYRRDLTSFLPKMAQEIDDFLSNEKF